MAGLGDYLDLTPDQARAQWQAILARPPRPETKGFRQVAFTPVETLLCLATMLSVNHRRFGGSTARFAPSPVPELASLFGRTPPSILAKMANLDGSRPNGARHEVETAATLLSDSERLATTYLVILDAARAVGIDEHPLPDFLGVETAYDLVLIGQDELAGEDIESAVEERFLALLDQMGDTPPPITERLLVAAARVGQHRFAKDVLANFDHACGFCGMKPGPGLERRGLLVASHIKAWRASTDRERLDVANGVAACPSHDAAFDTGLLWVNGGLRIHASTDLDAALREDPGMVAVFGRPPLLDRLALSDKAERPRHDYLQWHQTEVARAA